MRAECFPRSRSARAPGRRPDGRARIPQPSHIVNWLSFGMIADTVSASFGAGGARDDLESKRRNTLAFDYFSDLTGPPPEVTYSRSGNEAMATP